MRCLSTMVSLPLRGFAPAPEVQFLGMRLQVTPPDLQSRHLMPHPMHTVREPRYTVLPLKSIKRCTHLPKRRPLVVLAISIILRALPAGKKICHTWESNPRPSACEPTTVATELRAAMLLIILMDHSLDLLVRACPEIWDRSRAPALKYGTGPVRLP